MPLSPRTVMCMFLLCALGAAACRRQAAAVAESEPPLPVAAEAAQLGDIRGLVSATGLVETLPGADFIALAPEPARIIEVSKNVGERVSSGEVLVRLEFPSLKAEGAARTVAVKGAEVRLQGAKLAQSRIQGLFDRGAASQKEVDDGDREVAEAEVELAQAREGLNATQALGQRSVIRAPFDGSVAERLHNPGELVGNTPSDVILRVIDPRQVEVTASVSLADAARFTTGASARAIAEGGATTEPLRVVARPEAVAGATSVSIRLVFDRPTDLVAGTQVGVEIDAEQHSNATLVPVIAVVRDERGDAAVFVALGNEARKRPVVTGLIDTEHIEIRSGVKPGELVITQGQSNLRDGAAITISQ